MLQKDANVGKHGADPRIVYYQLRVNMNYVTIVYHLSPQGYLLTSIELYQGRFLLKCST